MGDETAALAHETEQLLRDRARVGRSGALLGQELERARDARLLEPVTGLEKNAAGRIDPRAFVHRHHRREHREARGLRRLHFDPGAREPQRRRDETWPVESAVGAPELV